MATPLLAIEVLSPSTRPVDRTLKRAVFQDAGVPSYLMVDPSIVASLTVLELVDGQYVERASVFGDQPSEPVSPYPVRVVPADLVRRPAGHWLATTCSKVNGWWPVTLAMSLLTSDSSPAAIAVYVLTQASICQSGAAYTARDCQACSTVSGS